MMWLPIGVTALADIPAVRGYFWERPCVPKPAIHRNTKALSAMSGSADLRDCPESEAIPVSGHWNCRRASGGIQPRALFRSSARHVGSRRKLPAQNGGSAMRLG